MMKALVYTDTQVMQYRDEPKPEPGPMRFCLRWLRRPFVALICMLIMVWMKGVCRH